MVANLRCNELRDEAVELVLPKINQVNDEAHRGKIENFQTSCIYIIKQALSHYEEFAH